ncbi:MAG: hypothetical protein QOE70_3870 [Chthoniobacter sp.]|jgi:hypothetical protein|nr:hypothetical protein [Chthoniobacter sp.]
MKTRPKLEKTVYIIGAGFSAPAGGPDQSRLMERMLTLPDADAKTRDAKKALEDFLVDVMNIAPSNKSDITLEDIYTPIDRCLADGVSLRDRTPTQLQDLRGQMEYLISFAIDQSFDVKASKDPSCSDYANNFAQHLVEIASIRAKKAKGAATAAAAKAYDPFAVISLNWDTLFDKAVYRALRKRDGNVGGDFEPIGLVDYCCYISSIGAAEPRIRPGLWALGARGYNVKLLKIHGFHELVAVLQLPAAIREF